MHFPFSEGCCFAHFAIWAQRLFFPTDWSTYQYYFKKLQNFVYMCFFKSIPALLYLSFQKAA